MGHLNRTEPSRMLLVTPVLFLLWQNKMCAERMRPGSYLLDTLETPYWSHIKKLRYLRKAPPAAEADKRRVLRRGSKDSIHIYIRLPLQENTYPTNIPVFNLHQKASFHLNLTGLELYLGTLQKTVKRHILIHTSLPQQSEHPGYQRENLLFLLNCILSFVLTRNSIGQ